MCYPSSTAPRVSFLIFAYFIVGLIALDMTVVTAANGIHICLECGQNLRRRLVTLGYYSYSYSSYRFSSLLICTFVFRELLAVVIVAKFRIAAQPSHSNHPVPLRNTAVPFLRKGHESRGGCNKWNEITVAACCNASIESIYEILRFIGCAAILTFC